ncbi:MAG: peptidoglycan editing factor PgeF [Ruminococcaceae bacterium]|nr:peptidoglycan editing factor PgeF [Oscillospiraceae bacterium]
MNTVPYQSGFSLVTGDLPRLVCRDIGVPHGFSTRFGGVSHGNGLDSLDLGAAAGSEEVAENRRRLAEALGSSPDRMFSARQIHSATVETVTSADLGREFACDGFVTAERGLLLTVKTADCVPILLCDEVAGVVAAVHAGWRGTVAGIAREAVKAMTTLGASPSRIAAAIGPCIHRECYEVDEPFLATVKEQNEALTAFVTPLPHKEGHYLADLVAMNRYLLLSAGLTEGNLYACGFCTDCASEVFFSHRASGGKRGLMMAGIRLP